jgi:hypothetical protein
LITSEKSGFLGKDGNSPTSKIMQVLRDNLDTIIQFKNSETESILVLA